MDSGAQSIKVAIIARVGKIVVENYAYIGFILKKGKVDNNYLVRFVTERENKKIQSINK